jgi:hydrogenase-4 component B
MIATTLTCIFPALCALGILVAILLPEKRNPLGLAIIGSIESIALSTGSGMTLFDGAPMHSALWSLPSFGQLDLNMDRLSALFAFVTGLVFLPVSIFSASYLRRYQGHYSLKFFAVLYHGLFFSIGLILLASDCFLFLLAWEAMGMLSYLLVNYEHEREEAAQASYLMLVMSEAGMMLAMVGLLLLVVKAGSLNFSDLKTSGINLDAGTHWAVFLLTFFGFGVKAGLVPSSAWLPLAHPAAIGNVSALLSGVILNLGIYGIIRVNLDVLPISTIGPGVIVLIIGTVSALIGILYATTENDLKKVLAHSSIENMGIVTVGLGAGILFSVSGKPILAAVAYVTALFHLINHSFYKSLLFLAAGTVDARTGTRDLDRLGGLVHRMPWTSVIFLMGVLAIAALPPFNGFVSEWLTLQTLLRSADLPSVPWKIVFFLRTFELPPVTLKIVFALCGAGIALTAALAMTCFAKVFAMGFLGIARSSHAEQATETKVSALAAKGLLAMLCLLLGILPTYVIAGLDPVAESLAKSSALTALVPPFFAKSPGHTELPNKFTAEFHDLGAQVGQGIVPGRSLIILHRGGTSNPVVFAGAPTYLVLVLFILLVLSFGLMRYGLARRRKVARTICWDGGIRRLLPEMTYTATGFSNSVRVIFQAIFRPTIVEDTRVAVAEHFRTAIRRERAETHIIDRFILEPFRDLAFRFAHLLARMHQGRINVYTTYVLVGLLCLLFMGLFL